MKRFIEISKESVFNKFNDYLKTQGEDNEVLLNVDKDAYYQEFTEWLENQNLISAVYNSDGIIISNIKYFIEEIDVLPE